MPIYRFRCKGKKGKKQCVNEVEKMVPHNMAEREELLNDTPCDMCGSPDWIKVFSPPNVSLKGLTTPGPR